MKSKYDILNDVNIDVDKYKEIKFDNNDEFKSKIKSKLRNRKSKYNKGLVAASLLAIVSAGILSNENVLAYIEDICYSVSDIVNMKEDEVSTYRYNINKVAEDKDIKILFKNIILDDGKLLIDVNVDYSKFNPFKEFTKKQQKDWEVEKWGNRDTILSVTDLNEIYIDGVKFVGMSWGIGDHKRNDESKKSVDVILEQGINAIENETKDSYYEEINKGKFPYVIDKNKTYNFKINIKKLHLGENYELYYDSYEEAEKDGGPHAGTIRGNWEVDFDIKGSNLVDMSKSYKIDKDINIGMDKINKNMDVRNPNKIANINIKNIKISPLSIKLNYTYSGINNVDIEKIKFKIQNENGESVNIKPTSIKYTNKEVITENQNTLKDYSKLKIVPYIVDKDENIKEILYDKSIEVNIDK